MVKERRRAKHEISQRKLEEYANSYNKRSTSTQSSSSSTDGRYSYETSNETYRLTISNGRWNLSTAMKISGNAKTEYSSGKEVNGTLYMGAAAVGSTNGSCASVGTSPQMCK